MKTLTSLIPTLLSLTVTFSPVAARDVVTVNDQARYVAGLPVPAESPLEPYTRTPGWQNHSQQMDAAWIKCEQRFLSKTRTWASEFLGRDHHSHAPMIYLFSGPDILYANTLFPDAATYVLCATEPIGGVPDILQQPPEAMDPALENLRRTLSNVLRFSYFITKDMRADLSDQRLGGTVPVMLFFLARLGCNVQSVENITLDSAGNLGRGKTPGVKIVFSAGGRAQTIYYFKSDLSDGGVKGGGVLPFCERLGDGNSMLKAASYLMHGDGFSTVRSFLLNHSRTLVQDDSGIPFRYFDQEIWKLRYFGNYVRPIELFQKYYQPDLAVIYDAAKPAPLDFTFSYQWEAEKGVLMIGTRTGGKRPVPKALPVR